MGQTLTCGSTARGSRAPAGARTSRRLGWGSASAGLTVGAGATTTAGAIARAPGSLLRLCIGGRRSWPPIGLDPDTLPTRRLQRGPGGINQTRGVRFTSRRARPLLACTEPRPPRVRGARLPCIVLRRLARTPRAVAGVRFGSADRRALAAIASASCGSRDLRSHRSFRLPREYACRTAQLRAAPATRDLAPRVSSAKKIGLDLRASECSERIARRDAAERVSETRFTTIRVRPWPRTRWSEAKCDTAEGPASLNSRLKDDHG
jgi:hypothetical protein